MTGEIRGLPQFTRERRRPACRSTFEPHQSFFVVFPRDGNARGAQIQRGVNFPAVNTGRHAGWRLGRLVRSQVGRPREVTFEPLQDWTKHAERGIKYYSGIATYRKSFEISSGAGWEKSGIPKDPSTQGISKPKSETTSGRAGGPISISAPSTTSRASASTARTSASSGARRGRWRSPMPSSPERTISRSRSPTAGRTACSATRARPDKDVRTLKWESGLLGGKEYKAGRYTFATGPGLGELLPSGLLGPVTLQVISER